MKFKNYTIQIWFIDDDLKKSAEYLTNSLLNKTINGCYQALVATYFYFYGIRSAKFYKYSFNKDHKAETMDKLFPAWPLKLNPKFANYGSRQSKWCRKCKEHFDYIKTYMQICCDEYEYRTGKAHGLSKFIEWLEYDAPFIKIPIGNVKKINLEWKVLNPKYRRKNIIEGYRLQYKSIIVNNGLKESEFMKRDIPSFLIEKDNKWLD